MSAANKGLANVGVRVTKGAADETPPAEAAEIDQRDCMYRPRVQAVVAGQKLLVKTSDATLHNVHTWIGKETVFNRAMPNTKVPPIEHTITEEGVLRVQCDVHPWMKGYVLIAKNTHFAVTGADGAFELKGLAPGTYTVEAWHEKLGTRSAEVTIADKVAEASFSFEREEK